MLNHKNVTTIKFSFMRKIYSALIATCKKTASIFLAVLFCLIFKNEVGFGQTTVPFTTAGSTTWFCPAGITSVTVECWGGGGAGGAVTGNTAAGGGGAGGAYAKATFSVVPGTTYSLFVGAGGIGTATTAGPSGGSSWFNTNSTLLAIGGTGGSVATLNGSSANGATAPTSGNIGGTTNFYGGNGSNSGTTNRGGSGGGSAGTAADGNDATTTTGGTAVAGGGAGATGSTNSADGTNATALGGGGAGGRTSNGTDRGGGDGFTGKVSITYATPGTYKSQFISIDITEGGTKSATQWCAGETRDVVVKIKNIGTAAWTDISGFQDINVGLKWNTNGASWADYYVRVDAQNLAPGATGTYTLTITASNATSGPVYGTPLAAGANNLTSDVVYEAVSWFGNNGGGVGPGNTIFTSPTITIVAVPTAPTGSASQVFCATTSPTVANLTATGSSIQWYAAATGGTALASTTSLVNGTHYFASQTNAAGCESSSRLDVTASVYTPLTGISYSLDPAVYCSGVAITANNPSIAGGTATLYSVSPALPAGLSLSTSTGVITGTPTTATLAANYTVTASNTCGSVTVPLNITISPAAPTVLNYTLTTASYCLGTAIANNNPSNTGGASTSYSVSPALPAGLSLNSSTGVISGTPTSVTASNTYTVTASNSCGSTTKALTIVVITTPSVTYSTNPAVYCAGVAIAANNPANTGGPATSYSVSPALPAGLSLNTSTGVITGTPTTTAGIAAANYTVTAANTCGSTTVVVNITISPAAPTVLNYTLTPASYCLGTAIANNNPSNTGGASTLYSVSPALPAGLSLNTSTGVISGTPTAVTASNTYTVTASNSCGSTTKALTIVVITTPSITYSTNPAVYCAGVAIAANNPTNTGGPATSYSVSPALPAGLALSTSTGIITGTPTTTAGIAAANYTVTATNTCGSTTVAVNITISPAAPTVLNYTLTPASYCLGTAIANNNPSNTGGASTSYSVSPALPPGLSLNTSTGVISGTPTAVTASNTYTVTASNSCGSTTKALTIVVITTPSITYSTNPAVYCAGVAIAANNPANTGGAATSYSVSPALPAGLSLSTTTGIITGTPTTTAGIAAANYTVTAANTCGSTTVAVNITISPAAPTVLNYTLTTASYCLGTAITNNNPSNTGGASTSYSVSPALPSGLSLNTSTGVISGTPTAVTASNTYTVTASNSCGSTTKGLTILVSTVGSWIGVTSTNWFTASNWGCGTVPDATIDVIIPAVGSVPNQPTINAVGAVCRNITINGALTVAGGPFNLDIYGDWTNNGAFIPFTGTIIFNGGSNNILNGTSGTTFNNLTVNKNATVNTLTSNTKAFAVNNTLAVTQGNLILTATDVSYAVKNIIVPAAGILTDNVNWNGTLLLSVTGNIDIDGIFNYTSGTPHVNMNGGGAKSVRSGTNPASAFGYLTLSTGSYTASGQLTVNSNFWAMFNTGGSFTTGNNIVTANAGILIAGGSTNINGGTLNVTGGIYAGYSGVAGILNFSTGTLNTDFINVGDGAITGNFNHSGGTANIGNLLISSTGTYTASNSPIINITGNWTNNKTFTPATSQVNFIGTAVQTVGGTIPTTFNNFKIANAAGINLTTNATVNSTLDLTNGLITTPGANVVTAATGSNITNASANSYVNGKLARGFATGAGSRFFPIGKGGNYRPLTFTYGNSTVSTTVTAEQFESPLTGTITPSTTNLYTARYWEITKTGTGTFNYTVTLDPNGFTPSGLVKIVKKEGTSTALTATDATTPNYTNSTAFTTFNSTSSGTNDFALASDCSSAADAGAALADICGGATSAPLGGSISGTATGGLWSDGGVGGTFNPNASTLNATWTAPAAYFGTATLLLTPTGGLCAPNTTDSKPQLVKPIPTGTLTATENSGNTSNDNIICAGGSVTFTFSNSSYTSYIFKVNGVQAQSGGSNTFSSSSLPNNASVTVDVANSSNCGATFGPIVIIVNPLPTPTLIASSTAICPNDNVTFTAAGGTSYTFKINGSPAITSASPTYSTTTLNNGDVVSVDVTNVNGCSASSAGIPITVNAVPTGTLGVSPSTTICAGDNVTFTASGTYTSYEFFVNSISVQGPSATKTYSTTSLANGAVVSVVAKNSSNCSAPFNPILITVNPLPMGSITTTENSGTANDNNICAGDAVTFTASPGFTNYKFYLRNTATLLQGGGSNVYTTSTLANNDYVTVVVTNSNNCINTFPVSATITVIALPVGTLTSPKTTICAGDNLVFTATAGFSNYNFKVNNVQVQNGSANTYNTSALVNNDVVTVEVTGVNNCIATFGPLTITVNALPTGTLVPVENSGITADDGIICTGAMVVFTAPTGFTNYDFLLNGATVQSGASRTYTSSSLANGDNIKVAVKNASNCIALLNTIVMTVNTLPAVQPITGTLSVCVGKTTPLANVTAGGTWSSSNTSFATVDAFGVVTGVGAGNVNILYTVTNGNLCATTVSASVTVNPLPIVTAITGNLAVCVSSTTQLASSTNGGVWSSSDPSIASVSATGLVSGVLAGNATISYTVTNGFGCITTVTANVVVNALPSAGFITGTLGVCMNNTTTLSNTTGGGVWSSASPAIATVNSSTGVVTGVASGSASISYTVTNANNCVTTVMATVTVFALPTPTLSGANPICPNTTETYTTQSGQSNYIWSFTGGTLVSGGTPLDNTITITWDQPGVRTIYVNYTDANGCSGATSATLTTSTGTVPTLIGTDPVCLSDDGSYTTQASQTNYVWTVIGGNITVGGSATDYTATINWNTAGNQSVSVNFTDISGCTGAAPTVLPVTVNPLPAITNTPLSQTICSGTNTTLVTLTANVNKGLSFAWTATASAGVSGFTASGTGTIPVQTISTTGTTQGTVTYTIVATANGCPGPAATYTVYVDPKPAVTNTPLTQTICSGGSTSLVTLTANVSGATFSWTASATAGVSGFTASGSGDIPVQTISTTGTTQGTVTYAITATASGCPGTVTYYTVLVDPKPAISNPSLTQTICSAGSTTLVTLTSNVSGSTFAWTATATAGVIGFATSGTGTIPVQTISTTGTTQGTVTYSITASAAGCPGPATNYTVLVNPLPAVSNVSLTQTVCSGGSTSVVNLTSTVASTSYTWTASATGGVSGFTAGGSGNIPVQTISTTSLTQGTVTYVITPTATGCPGATTNYTVLVNPLPVVTNNPLTQTICSGTGTSLVTLTSNIGGVTYTWTATATAGVSGFTASGSGNIPVQTISTTGTTQGTVTYTVTPSASSCPGATATYKVFVDPKPVVTNTFTSPSYCLGDAATGISFTSNVSGATFAWTSSANIGFGTSGTGNIPGFTTTNPGTTATISVIASNGSCSGAASAFTITVNALPAPPTVTPTTATICQGSILPLTAGTSTSTGSVTFSSGNISALLGAIPDNNPAGVASAIAVSGIPGTATINSVSINFNITHTYDADLIINLKAPNTNVLNIVNQAGGSGDNFTNTTVSSLGSTVFSTNSSAAPFTGTYRADADFPVAGATTGGGNTPNVTLFTSLFGTPNGNWQLSARDVAGADVGTLNNWSITINYTVAALPQTVTWSPITDLYTDAAATVPYAGQNLSNVYANPATSGTKLYTATATNASSCGNSSTVTLTVNPTPTVTISAAYCAVPGKVRLTANSSILPVTYQWSTGQTTQVIDVDIAAIYKVIVSSGGCSSFATIQVAQELVVNGDFNAGNTGFVSDYTYVADQPGLVPAGQGELYNDAGTLGYSITPNGQNVHINFWGKDHTTGSGTVPTGNFMAVNGHGNTLVVWKETVNVLPNTTYYFSAWGMSLNNATPFAQLQFSVNGALVGTAPILPAGVNNNNNGYTGTAVWTRFYGTWTSGPTTTTADIYINNLQAALGGNDFGIDDISFGSLSTFVILQSAVGTDAQTVCRNSPITTIVYNVGNGNASGPTVTGLPAGVTSVFAGDILTFNGTPTAPAGTYTYTITTTGCVPYSVTGTITVESQTIALASGSSSPSVCVNSPVNIGFTLSGTATNASTSGLPAGVNGTVSGSGPTYTYTLSGTTTAAPGSYPYTITTSGTCTPVTFTGTITVTSQTITLNTAVATTSQTVCITDPIVNIQYTVGGTGNGATVTGLPPGVTGSFNSGFFVISGAPTSAAGSPYSYTVTTSGPSCTPVSAVGTITVTPAATITLSSAAGTGSQTVCISNPIVNITYAIGGSGTGASITAGALPAGLNTSFSGGVFTISGTPNVSGSFNYTITTSGGCGFATITGTMLVQTETLVLTSGAASPTVCINTAMPSSIVYTMGGTATSTLVTGLPANIGYTVVGNIITISGTPNVSGSYPYTVTASGTCGTVSLTGQITVSPAPNGGTLTSVSICSGNSGSITLSGSAGTINGWEISINNGVTWNPTPILNTSITQSYSNVTIPTQYRVVVSNSCGTTYSTVATVGIHNLWTGAIDNDWSKPGNWSDNMVASNSCPIVYIPNVPNQPTLSTSAVPAIISLVIDPSAYVTIATNGILTIGGTITNNGSFDVRNGGLNLNGGTTQSIAGSWFVGNTIQSLIVDNPNGLNIINTNDILNISGEFTFGNVNNVNINTNDNLVFTSTSTGTARVSDVTNGGVNFNNNFVGKATVQRYFPATRAWRLITAPVSGTGTIYQTWQNNGVWDAGKGMLVTGSTAPAGSLDMSYQMNSSLKTGANLTEVLNPGAMLLSNPTGPAANIGYFAFVRGDRDPANTIVPNTNVTTLSAKGYLQVGTQTFPASSVAAAFTLIGNPYMSPVDFNKLGLNNLERRFYAWDPRLNVVGGYVVVEDLLGTGNYTVTPPSPGKQYTKIQSSQAIFVQTSLGAPASLTFTEQAKSDSLYPLMFRPLGQPQSIRINLNKNNGSSKTLADGTYAEFDDRFSKEVTIQDALKFGNINELIGFYRSNKMLAVERRPTLTSDDTLYIRITKTTQRKYNLDLVTNHLAQNSIEGFLIDNFLNTTTPIDLNGTNSIDFEVNSNSSSAAPDRFKIVFKQLAPLPVTFKSIKAYEQSDDIQVDWTVENELNIVKYDVEKSIDGVSFVNVNTTMATGSNSSINNYKWLDKNAVDGNNYYRVRSTGSNGKTDYTTIVIVKISRGPSGIRVYPNPVTTGIIQTEFRKMDAGIYKARLLNAAGQSIVDKTINHAAGTSLEYVRPDYRLPSGIYQLEITAPDKTSMSLRVIIK
ncbi:hypothetical protein BH11BAC3_BH11BAC3_00270 [soil metagenome]